MKNCFLILLISLFTEANIAVAQSVFQIDSLPRTGVLLDKSWKYQTGDNPDWAKPGFDDSAWEIVDPSKAVTALPQIFNSQVKWLRFNFEIKNKPPTPLGISINQAGASEIYLNGQKIHEFGQFDTDPSKVQAFDPLEDAILFPADSVGKYTLAVRYALQPNIRYTNIFGLTKNRLFHATVLELHSTLEAQRNFLPYKIGLDIFIMGVAFMLFLLHSAFYIYNRSNKTQLILAVYLLGIFIIRAFKMIGQNQHSAEARYWNLNIANWLLGMVIVCLAIVIYRMARVRWDIYFYGLVAFQLVYVVVSSFSDDSPVQTRLLLIGNIYNFFVLIRVIRKGLKNGIKGLWTVGAGIFIAIFGLAWISLAFLFLNHGVTPTGYNALKYGFSPYFIDVVFNVSNIAIPTGLSLFMGIEGNETNKALSRQLIENEQLKNKAIEQEQEKQYILETQNETLEKQVAERTAELNQSLERLKTTQTQLIQSEKLASLGELTAGIAHEIQNPLNFVNNFSELSVDLVKEIKEEIEKPELDKAYIDELFTDLSQNQEKINYHGNRASSIVKGMLEHSRTSTGVRELTDLNKLVDEFLRLSYHGLRAKDKSFNARFNTDFEKNLPKVNVISQDLGRVLVNLFNNAFYAVQQRAKAPPLGGGGGLSYQPSIFVSTQKTDNQITIKVRDNGNGIPASIKDKIFQPFFTTKPTGEGTGLGLSLSYDIVTKGHGGTLEVNSKEGEGTEFVITLPQ